MSILTGLMSRSAIALGIVALGASLSGCAAAAFANLAPMGVAAAQMTAITAAEQASGGADAKDDQSDRCDELVKTAPGVEEVRKAKDGSLESRQWRLTERDGKPIWIPVKTPSAPVDGWEPHSKRIASLKFTPPLADMLVPGEPEFIAYAPVTATTPAEGDQMASMTSSFGAGDGVFVFRGRSYSFVLVKELPCFKPVQ